MLTPEAVRLVLDKLPDSDTTSEANAEDEDSDSNDDAPLSLTKGKKVTGGKAATAVKAVKKTEAAPKGEKKQQHCLTAMSSGLVHLATQVYSNPPGESTNDQVVKLLVCRVKQG